MILAPLAPAGLWCETGGITQVVHVIVDPASAFFFPKGFFKLFFVFVYVFVFIVVDVINY